MSELPNRDNLFPREVAKFLRISLTTIYDMLQEGSVPAKRIGGQWRIPRKEFLDWYERQRTNQESLSA